MRDPWVYRCPNGHAGIEVNRDSYRCQSCERVFDGDPVDARRVDGFPIAADDRARLTPVGAGLLVFGIGMVYLVAILLFSGGVSL